MKGKALLLGAAVGLGAWACSSTAPATGQDPLPAEATRTAAALATLEVKYDQCQDFHRAAYEAANLRPEYMAHGDYVAFIQAFADETRQFLQDAGVIE